MMVAYHRLPAVLPGGDDGDHHIPRDALPAASLTNLVRPAPREASPAGRPCDRRAAATGSRAARGRPRLKVTAGS